ncbi:MAG: drug/metabolite exporter YedA [Chloroflexi bacterium]|nr:drug/metabolite exporter YedA [Chloroflexota bacterium]
MSESIRTRITVGLALLSVYLIWGSTYLGIRFALESFPPLLMAGFRFLIAGTLMFTFLRLRGTPMPTRRQWLGAAVIGAFLLGGGNGGVTFAEQWVSSGLAAVVIASMPLWAALFGGLWKRWPNRLEWVGLMVGFAGVAVLNLEHDFRANPLGAIVLFGAAISWAFGSVLSGRLQLPKGPMSSAAQMLVGGVLMLALGALSGERITALPSARSAAAFGYLITFGSLIAFSSYAYLLRTVRPTLATSYAYVNPLVAVGLGVLLGGEKITAAGLIATLVILGGVGLVAMGRARPTRPVVQSRPSE